MPKIIDDVFEHLKSDIDKIRVRHRQYISYSNEQGAHSVFDEILYNCVDECRNPRSPGNDIKVKFDERDGFVTVKDNGRGIPTNILEEVYTSLNMGSNINTSNKAELKAEILGQNGTGTLAICGLAECVEITSFRGGTEDIFKKIVFEEGKKVHEETGKCSKDNHGMLIKYKPSKVMGKNTRLLWKDIKKDLLNFQYLNKHGIKMSSEYYEKDGSLTNEKYKILPFVDILNRNSDPIISNKVFLVIDGDNIIEELDGTSVKRFLSMDIAFAFTSSLTPYIDSFSNSNNTVDNGDHLDGALEAICRYFQVATRNGLSEKEKNSLDIKWDDVKSGLSIAVALRTNFERLYTGQTKHKVVNTDIKKIITTMTMESLTSYFAKNPGQLKELCSIIKMNAKARREGDKIKSAVVKTVLTNWSSYKMPNYDPCINKGKEYKELFIVEGLSAKGSLKDARFPQFQALFAIRGVSANVYKLSLDQIVGPKGNKEFTDLTTIMGCNIGPKFDLSKLQFDKIIIASDADIDGYFIRSLLMSFYFKVFPEIIEDGRLYIAIPPLYKVEDKKNPFVVNKADYIDRYVKSASKVYKVCYVYSDGSSYQFTKEELVDFLTETNSYVKDLQGLRDHYKTNIRLLEMIYEEFALMNFEIKEKYSSDDVSTLIKKVNIQHLIDRINIEFPEIYYDDNSNLIIGSIDTVGQVVELTIPFIKKAMGIITLIKKWIPNEFTSLNLINIKTGTENKLSLFGALNILKQYQPDILHRYKGLGENSSDDIRTTIMDPNTRTLIKVQMGDIENDMKVFQTLRGNSPADALRRKQMMKEFKINIDDIDT